MATTRRLSDTDVRSIFESLHGKDKRPPPHLNVQIVPAHENGLKLSPPSYEYEDGLYVLLRPTRKRKKTSSTVPDHLTDLIMTSVPVETCPWSLSGPQFPKPTAIQQRYCYPKGNPEYSDRKGATLWTMYGRDGKEDLEFRLLHVYVSAKRASNKGIDLLEEQRAQVEAAAVDALQAMRQPTFIIHTNTTDEPSTTTTTINNKYHSTFIKEPFAKPKQNNGKVNTTNTNIQKVKSDDGGDDVTCPQKKERSSAEDADHNNNHSTEEEEDDDEQDKAEDDSSNSCPFPTTSSSSLWEQHELLVNSNDGDGILTLTLNRPEHLNALNRNILKLLFQELTRASTNKQSIRVIVLQSKGSVFCSGTDWKEVQSITDDSEKMEFWELHSQVMQLLNSVPQPTICAVQGLATSAGCELVAACDLVISGPRAGFSTPGVTTMGLFCHTPAVPLVRCVGMKRALDMLYTGRVLSAQEALSCGLITRVGGYPQKEAAKLASQLAAQSGCAMQLGKETVYRQVSANTLQEAYHVASAAMMENLRARDAQHGISCFLEHKQPPPPTSWKHE